VFKIFGPGNQYVTKAKEMVRLMGTDIDMPAGPSEVLVIADQHADPAFVAADLLSQAEHGADSQVVLVTDSFSFVRSVEEETEKQLYLLPRKDLASKALANSLSIVFRNLEECIEFSNYYAPEHLIIATNNPRDLAKKVKNAGSVFLGRYSCESAGDYASGTNHTLPTNGHARVSGGVAMESFMKKITFQELTPEGIKNIGPAIEKMAAAEGLQAHKNAVTIRLTSLDKK
jgi:histidinol dehydrogenase